MTDFNEVLISAVNGDKKAVENIIVKYMPLINKLSVVNGRFDEDLKQVLCLHIVKNISKFKITESSDKKTKNNFKKG